MSSTLCQAVNCLSEKIKNIEKYINNGKLKANTLLPCGLNSQIGNSIATKNCHGVLPLRNCFVTPILKNKQYHFLYF